MKKLQNPNSQRKSGNKFMIKNGARKSYDRVPLTGFSKKSRQWEVFFISLVLPQYVSIQSKTICNLKRHLLPDVYCKTCNQRLGLPRIDS